MEQLREIIGFPMYRMDADGNVHSLGRYGRPLIKKVRKQKNKTEHSLVINLRQDGKWRVLSYYRLRYAVDHGICYDDIPQDFHIMPNNDGTYRVATKQEHMEVCNNYVEAARRRERLKRIDEKIHELGIMRRAYSKGGDHVEAVQYIESRKSLFINHHMKRYGTKREKAEDCYALALEWMIDKINSPVSQVTELTVSMMGLMNKIRQKHAKEYPLGLRNEKPSNSLAKNQK